MGPESFPSKHPSASSIPIMNRDTQLMLKLREKPDWAERGAQATAAQLGWGSIFLPLGARLGRRCSPAFRGPLLPFSNHETQPAELAGTIAAVVLLLLQREATNTAVPTPRDLAGHNAGCPHISPSIWHHRGPVKLLCALAEPSLLVHLRALRAAFEEKL